MPISSWKDNSGERNSHLYYSSVFCSERDAHGDCSAVCICFFRSGTAIHVMLASELLNRGGSQTLPGFLPFIYFDFEAVTDTGDKTFLNPTTANVHC